jgi:type I restriction enzyme R subunit
MADEAHRGQYGLEEKIDTKTGRVILGTARIIRDSLPNATYVGFTGTPISSKDRSTIEVFGNYIDIYDMTQAVEDGATRPVYYESRVIHLKLDSDILKLIDNEYDRMLVMDETEPYLVEKSKKELGRMESILGAEQTITALCEDIIKHYKENRQYEITGKAIIVAYSRTIAMAIYRKLLELRPNWNEKAGVVMTSGNNDPEEWRDIIGNKRYRDEMAKKFKNNEDLLKIAIVVDMKAYLNGMLSNEEVIAELMKMAKDMAAAHAEGGALGLTDEDLSLKRLAGLLSIHPHQLSAYLNRELNMNFNGFINNYRIEEAVIMMKEEPERSLLSIAFAVGFNSKSVFYSAFTKKTGTSPAKFRKQV